MEMGLGIHGGILVGELESTGQEGMNRRSSAEAGSGTGWLGEVVGGPHAVELVEVGKAQEGW